ncbi:hypothetical protein [Streptomyces sp. NPDC056921]|uniref:hypothetical protein n=1 Tax=Streptomyces sp. NPDC056921 TaxID=3345966 RepID=UPI00364483F0
MSVAENEAPTPHLYTGLQVRFADDAVVAKARPAGWCDPGADPRGKNGNTPLCVLGPMTEQQRFDLTNALIHHVGTRWDTEADNLP